MPLQQQCIECDKIAVVLDITIPYCIDCDYHVSTEQYPKRWKPKQETWYKKKTKDSEQKIRDYFKNKYKKKADFVCPF